MANTQGTAEPLRHRQVEVDRLSLHVVEGGSSDRPPVLLLHGWPESWSAFERVMIALAPQAHVVAFDLPGVGRSTGLPRAHDKRTLAGIVRRLADELALTGVSLIGHDVGAQIVYACLRTWPAGIRKAVLMNIVIPGIDPWDEVKRNPAIWHFAFHAVPDLPEAMVAGNQRRYFDYFFDTLSASRGGVDDASRRAHAVAYARPESLTAGFEWYRVFPQDEKDNAAGKEGEVPIPVLYLRGRQERGDLERYVKGLRESGLRDVCGALIPDSGHFSPEEQPEAVSRALREFLDLCG